MNKLISKIVGVCLGLSLATGVGVGVAMGQDMIEAKADTTVTFEVGTDSGSKSVTKNNVTISTNNGDLSRSDQYRIYSGATFTVASETSANIIEIDFTYTQNKFSTIKGSLSADGTTWTGNTNSVDFSTSGGQVRVTKIVVTTSSGGDTPAEVTDYDYSFPKTTTFTTSALTQVLSDGTYSPSWTISEQDFLGPDTTNGGLQIGSRSSPTTGGTLKTSSFTDAVTGIIVVNRAYSSGTINVSVGGVNLAETAKSVSNTNTTSTFTTSSEQSLTGEIKFTFTNTSRAFYFISIRISFKTAETIHVTSIDLGSDFSLAKGKTQTIVPTIQPSNATNQAVTFASDDTSVATVDSSTGLVTAVAQGTAVITGTSVDNSSATDTVTVTVTKAIPTSMSWSKQNVNFEANTSLDTYFTESSNVIVIKYSDGTSSAAKSISDASLTIKLGSDTISYNYTLLAEDNGKQLEITYTEDGVVVSQKLTIAVNEPLVINSVSTNFVGGKAYLLVDDMVSTLSGTFSSLHGEPTLTVTTSNDDVVDVDNGYNTVTYDSEAKTGTFTIGLFAYSVGTASITIELSKNGKVVSTTYGPILVRESDPASGGSHYEKVTSTSQIVDGQYLFVFEDGLKAFNGGLSTLDATNNTISITIEDGEIPYSSTTAAAEFTIDKTDKTVLSASGFYIYGSSGSNILNSTTDSEIAGTTSMTIEDGHAMFVSKTSILAFNNASNQQRFRYFKSTSTISDTGNQNRYIQLYKLVEEEVSGDFDKALEFVNTFMHTEVPVTDEGSGKCISEGWYTAAKAAFINAGHSTATGYLQNAAQRAIVADSFSDYFARLQAWAAANGEVFELSNGDYVVSTQSAYMFPAINNENNAAVTAVIVVMALTVTTAGAYFFLRKKKEEK